MHSSKKYLGLFLTCSLITIGILANPIWAKSKDKNIPNAQNDNLTSLIFSGQIDKALQQIQGQSLKKIKSDAKNRLIFMQGYIYYQAGEFEKAATFFKEIKGEYKELNDYTDFYLALSLRESNDAKEAINILTNLKKQKISQHLQNKIGRELALSYCKAKNRGKAVELFNEMIQTKFSEIRSYQLKYDRSLCLIDLGFPDEAVITLKALYLNYPEGDLSDKILQTLKKINKESTITLGDHLTRGQRLMAKDRPQLAAKDFQQVVLSYGDRAPGNLVEQLAEAYFKSRQYPLAAKNYEILRDRYPSLFKAKAKLRLAQSYSRSDQYDKAIQAYENLAASENSTSDSELQYKIAYIYMDKGDLKEANKRFSAWLEAYPKSSRRAQILWFLGWNNYLLKNYQAALGYFDQLESAYSRHRLSDRVPYWRGRILDKTGNSTAARRQYQHIAEQDPFSYYGFLSLKRLENNLDPAVPPKGSWVKDIPNLTLPSPFSWNQLRPGGKKQLAQAQELLLVGLWEDFLGELAELTYGEGITGEVAKLKRDMDGVSVAFSQRSPERWTASYPPAYPTLVSLFSKTRQFPMAATWAIMREESRFRPNALSPAQAIGLMQIIPPTGAEIATDLDRQGFVPEWLYQPVTNIEFGVHYLNKNRTRFQGRFPETFASYNAGPDAVSRWIKARPNREFDEFIEEIPYKETNNYVKKVLKSYYIYKLIYSEGS